MTESVLYSLGCGIGAIPIFGNKAYVDLQPRIRIQCGVNESP